MRTTLGIAVAVLLGTSGAATAAAENEQGGPDLIVVGPVEAVDSAKGLTVVLGQRVHGVVDGLTVGDTAAVFGTMQRDGSISAVAIQARGSYVPGATSIFLAGTVQKAQPLVGRVVISDVTIDLTSVMSYGTFSPTVGSKLAVSGTQPAHGGVVVVNGASIGGIAGTGAKTSGIAGTGASAGGIAGTGAKTSGIAGTGASAGGIAGTGAKTSGIAGTGASAGGIAGTGAKTSGIAGTGASAGGIAGTGAKTSGIAGTGASAGGIAGTGAKTSGIAGTGASAGGIAGTGAKTSGIAGTGASAGGIAGTG
jgi:hypothetical protein